MRASGSEVRQATGPGCAQQGPDILPSGCFPSGASPLPTLPDSFRSMCQLPTWPWSFLSLKAKMAWACLIAFFRSAASACNAPLMFSKAVEEG